MVKLIIHNPITGHERIKMNVEKKILNSNVQKKITKRNL